MPAARQNCCAIERRESCGARERKAVQQRRSECWQSRCNSAQRVASTMHATQFVCWQRDWRRRPSWLPDWQAFQGAAASQHTQQKQHSMQGTRASSSSRALHTRPGGGAAHRACLVHRRRAPPLLQPPAATQQDADERANVGGSAPSSSSSSSSSSVQPAQQQQQEQPTPAAGPFSSALRDPPMLGVMLGVLFQTGAVLGTLLDGIHSRTGLQVYDVAPITLGPLSTSALVPPLLGTFYVVLGLLAAAADNLAPQDDGATAAVRQRCSSDLYVAASFGALAAALALSARLYEGGLPASQIGGALAAMTALNWAAFDGTKQGIALALLCGLGAPAAELVLMAATHCWHYSRPDALGGAFVSWVPWCYAFYTPAVSNLGRYLWQTCRLPEQHQNAPPGRG